MHSFLYARTHAITKNVTVDPKVAAEYAKQHLTPEKRERAINKALGLEQLSFFQRVQKILAPWIYYKVEHGWETTHRFQIVVPIEFEINIRYRNKNFKE